MLPSGGDFATIAVPVEPDAPDRFSTTTLTPSRCCSPACASRATASTDPPAGNGTMIRIGPDGQDLCARAANGASTAPATTVRLVSLAISIP